jgi:TonB-dependent receptor
LDTITAEQVGQFGAQNIGEAIQRISGVSLTRNNGEGESISVRGLSPEFTRLEIDGRSTAITADQANPGRDSLLSVFSADLYSSIEVVKSPVEGGVGGIVRLNTPNPLEIGRRTWGLQATLTDARLRDRAEPGYSVFYADVFAGGRLGLLLAATYEGIGSSEEAVQTGDTKYC